MLHLSCPLLTTALSGLIPGWPWSPLNGHDSVCVRKG
jgi:hypothetical protein